jgi:CheY-like chemotaxis protein
MLAVRDTGIGMDAATQARIFEPFFTTKEPGKGTGLGLSTVYGVVEQHEGHMAVRSARGEGASFEIYLPRVDAALPTTEVSPDLEPPKGWQTILVAEDDEDLRCLISEVLRELGYTVLVAGDGETALRVAERGTSPIDLLLTDMVMPHLSGRELAQRLTSAHPEARVLYMTGYAEIPRVLDGVVLKKPFTPVTLARAVHETLTTPPAMEGP